jgi:hypothetical protein
VSVCAVSRRSPLGASTRKIRFSNAETAFHDRRIGLDDQNAVGQKLLKSLPAPTLRIGKRSLRQLAKTFDAT